MQTISTKDYQEKYNTLQTNVERFNLIRNLFILLGKDKREPTEQYYTVRPKGKGRKKLNARALELLKKFNADPTLFPTAAEKSELALFSGWGGGLVNPETKEKGSPYEYYTPKPIAEGIWDVLKDLGFSGGKVLDPSSGTGIFGATSPINCVVDAVELSDQSGRVNQLINDGPGYSCTVAPFEKVASRTPDGIYDAVVTNVPFGDNASRGGNQFLDPRYQNEPLEGYFILRSLEKLRAGGRAAFIVPTRVLDEKGGAQEKIRQRASKIAEFVGAYRLPTGTFSSADTDVVTDVIFFRKFSDEVIQKIDELQEQDPQKLIDTNVFYQDFIQGTYFKSEEGRPYVLGTFQARDANKFRDTDKVLNNASLSELKELFLKKKLPKSRINWEALETAETEPIIYNEGDTLTQAGCTYQFKDGKWVLQEHSGNNLTYKENLKKLSDPYAAFASEMSFDEAQNVYKYIQDWSLWMELPTWLSSVMSVIKESPNKSESLWKKAVIALSCKQVLEEQKDNAGFNYFAEYQDLSQAILKEKFKKADEKILSPIGEAVRITRLQLSSQTKEGFTRVWLGDVEQDVKLSEDIKNNLKTPQARLAQLQYTSKSAWVDIEKAKEIMGDDFDPISSDDWCVSGDGKRVMSVDNYYVGNLQSFFKTIDDEILNCKDEKVKQKLINQKLRATERVSVIDVDALDFNLRSPYVSQEYKERFLKEYLNSAVALQPGKNGREFKFMKQASTLNEKFASIMCGYANTGRINLGNFSLPEGMSENDALRTLRKKAKELDVSFNSWVHANEKLMAELKKSAKDPEKLYFEEVEDLSPIAIPGMNPSLKLHGYQAAYVRKMGRNFSGINGFGVGLGKTFTALASVQHAQAIGAKKKTVFVVPNSVLSNWRKEASKAFSTIDDCLFVGLKEKKDGGYKADSKLYDEHLELIKENRHSKIFMTQQAFQRIRVREETLDNYITYMRKVDASFDAKLSGDGDNTDKKSKLAAESRVEEFKKNLATTGGTAPYLEDLFIDSIVIDEAHFYKNGSFLAEFEGCEYLSIASPAKMALDAQLKSWYIRGETAKNDGVLLLTATPITNSPLEIYSMLSLAVGQEQVGKQCLGCRGSDAFMQAVCSIDTQPRALLDGKIKNKSVFVGLNNLGVLRRALHSVVTVKEAKDVGKTLKLPGGEENQNPIDLPDDTKARLEVFKKAYRYAAEKVIEDDNSRRTGDPTILRSPEYQSAYTQVKALYDEPDKILGHPFNLIRKMENLIADPDLSDRASYYYFEDSQKDAIEKALMDFHKQAITEKRDNPGPYAQKEYIKENLRYVTVVGPDGKSEEKPEVTYTVVVRGIMTTKDGRNCVLLDSIDFEVQDAFERALEKNKVKFSVTIPPKLAALIDNFKNEMANPRGLINSESGIKKSPIVKQIVFCDQLGLIHKIKKLLAEKCGLTASKIAIVTGKVNNTPEKIMAVQDGFNANGEENKIQCVIANEKAEVGINLQIGTQAIHHLTIGWTPDSLVQRNGRGVRQGNQTEKVNIYSYDASGTFDCIRRTMVNHKANWINSVIDKTGGNKVTIAGGMTQEEAKALIDSLGNPEDVEAYQRNKEKREKETYIENLKESQRINLKIIETSKKFLADNPDCKNMIIQRLISCGQLLVVREDQNKILNKEKATERQKQRAQDRIDDLNKQIERECKILDKSANFFKKDGYGKNAKPNRDKQYSAMEVLNNKDSLLSYRSKAKELLEALENFNSSDLYIEPKENGVIFNNWKDQTKQSEALLASATEDFKKTSAEEGSYPVELVTMAGVVLLNGIPVRTGFPIFDKGLKMIVQRYDGWTKISVDENLREDTNTLVPDDLDYIYYPGTNQYEAAMKTFAEFDDAIVKSGQEAIFTPYNSEISQYRKTGDIVKCDCWRKGLGGHYFPVVITEEAYENGSELLKKLADQQLQIILKRPADRYSDFTIDKKNEDKLIDLESSDFDEALLTYAKANSVKIKRSDLSSVLRGDRAIADFIQYDFHIEDFNAAVPEGQLEEVRKAAGEFFLKLLPFMDITAEEALEILIDGDCPRFSPKQTYVRAFFNRVVVSKDSALAVLNRFDQDDKVQIKGDTYQVKDTIKEIGRETGLCYFNRYEKCWELKMRGLKKLYEEHKEMFAKSPGDSGIYAVYRGERLDI